MIYIFIFILEEVSKNLFLERSFSENLRTAATKSCHGVADMASKVVMAQLHSNSLWQLSSNSPEIMAWKKGFGALFS